MSMSRFLRLTARILPVLALSWAAAFAQESDNAPLFQLPICGKLPVPTQMHGSVVVGDRFYIFGGDSTGGWTDAVYSARITPQAQLADWRSEANLPDRRAYLENSVEAINDRIYIIGGSVAETSQTDEGKTTRAQDVLWTQVDREGKIAQWKRSEKFPGEPLSLLGACSDDKHLYVTGGSSGNVLSNAIHVCDLQPDGSPTNWRSAGKLPKILRFHGAAILNNRMYVWGGQHSRNQSDATQEVYSAPIQDAAIGEWRTESDMPAAVYSSTSCGFNDYVIAVGGRYVNAYPTNSLWFSQLNKEGVVLPWRTLKTNLDTRVYHSLGLDKTRGLVFISGGKNKITPDLASGNILENVAIFKLTQSNDTAIDPGLAAQSKGAMFSDLDSAMSAASASHKPVLAFLYAPDVPDCRRALDQVINTPKFQALQQNYTTTFIDVSTDRGSAASRKLSIFRVPALVEVDATGNVARKATGVRTWAEVEAMLKLTPSS